MEIAVLIVSTVFFIAVLIYWGEKVLIKSILTPYDFSKISDSADADNNIDFDVCGFSVTGDDGKMIPCMFIPHGDNGAAIEKAVILLGTVDSLKIRMMKYAPIFISNGIDVIIPEDEEAGVKKLFGYGYIEQSEIKPIVKWVKNIYADAEIGLFGVSYGADEALYYVESNHDVSFVIADSPYSDLSTFLKEHIRLEYRIKQFPLLTVAKSIIKRKGFDINKASPLKLIKKSEKETPVFFIHGENDSYFIPQMSVDLYNSKNKGYKKFWLAPEAEHAEAIYTSYDDYKIKTEEFLSKIGFIKGTEDR